MTPITCWSRRWVGLLLLLLLLPACTPTHTLTLDRQREAASRSRVLDAEPLRQTLTFPEGGVSEIELLLALPPTAPALASRPLNWEIRDSALKVLRQGTLETAGYLNKTPLPLRFAPLPAQQNAELVLTAAPEAQMALWTSQGDFYPLGTLLDNKLNRNVDLYFTLRAKEGPLRFVAALRAVADSWRGVAPWLPLMLIAPGWLLVWLLASRERRSLAPAVAALSLALAPLVYLWCSVVGLRLYEPLVQSLFQASALGLMMVMVRYPARVREGWQSPWRGPLAVLGLAITLGVVSWLLAGRTLLAPPGSNALGSGLLAQTLVRKGILTALDAPLPPAALTATLTQMSRQPVTLMLLLGALLLGVATIPSLYTLAAEVTRHPWAALWLVPLAWLWPAPWNALATGDLLALYSLVLLPVVVALGRRALRVPGTAASALLLAAFPLAALLLVQGILALVAWLVALGLAFVPLPPMTATPDESPPPPSALLIRALAWVAMAALLLLPAWFKGTSLTPLVDLRAAGYDWLLAILLLSALAGWLAPRLGATLPTVTCALLLVLLPLTWVRGVPIPTSSILLTQNDVELLTWSRTGIRPDAFFLINLEGEEGALAPTDSGLWVPMYTNFPTVIQRDLPPTLLTQAMQPERLADPVFRKALLDAGITHIYIGADAHPLKADDLFGQPWLRLAQQVGPAHIFELIPDPTPDASQG